MIRIISDTSTMYSTTQAQEAGFDVSALSVTIAGKSYREYDEITSNQFVEIIRQGHMPTSSQPAVGEVEALYQRFAGEEIINIAMAAGLSGTYHSAVAAAQLCDNAEDITVINTRTLCGPPPLHGGVGCCLGGSRFEQGRDRQEAQRTNGFCQELPGACGL